MSLQNQQRLRAGDHLASLELPTAPEGQPQKLRTASRDALALLLLPRSYGAWRDYLEALAQVAAEIEQWYARILVVVAGDLELAAQLYRQVDEKLTVLADADEDTFRLTGIAPAHAALIIADRYGQIYEVTEATELPSVAAIKEWVMFLATQCPECGVIDEPGYGEWTPAS